MIIFGVLFYDSELRDYQLHLLCVKFILMTGEPKFSFLLLPMGFLDYKFDNIFVRSFISSQNLE